MSIFTLPPRQGLYDPRNERDSCGVGMLADLRGNRSHDILIKGIEILENLTHRGACGCDPETGDGAGMTFQLPDGLFRRDAEQAGCALPPAGHYGVGFFFLPPEKVEREYSTGLVENVIREEGQRLLYWRDVPIEPEALGWLARSCMPVMRQVVVGSTLDDPEAFERKLYVIRKRLEIEVRKSGRDAAKHFYVPSFSSRTIVYKGLLVPHQLSDFYKDLSDPLATSGLVLVHSRYSTNTFPTWPLAQPFRYLCHNGEINTLRGNVNWMRTREALLASGLFGDDLRKILPTATPGASDSAQLDNVLELLVLGGRSLPHAVMMMIPEAWGDHIPMDPDKRAFYEYHSCLMEPWDGPALISFTDGRSIGAVLDRNGLRPSRYTVTKSGLVVGASETGVLEIPPHEVEYKGRLQPGKMFLVDFDEGRIVGDDEIKRKLCTRRPYREWMEREKITLSMLPEKPATTPARLDDSERFTFQRAFGYSREDLRFLIGPMANRGEEAVGSMGTDTPLAVLSDHRPLVFSYFKQLFAQVTNPPIDPIREEIVMSVHGWLGPEGNLFDETQEQAHRLELERPILRIEELEKIRQVSDHGYRTSTLPMLFPVAGGEKAFEDALETLCRSAEERVLAGDTFLILSDRGVDPENAPLPSLLALSAVHHHLIREGLRTRVGLVVETGDAREVMHFALLAGYGATAIHPWLAFETLYELFDRGLLDTQSREETIERYIKSIRKGLLKIFSKMGISTLQSYTGAQIFEAIGLNSKVVDRYFSGTASRIEGVGIEVLARESLLRHEDAYPALELDGADLDVGGQYQWRVNGEHHMWNPDSIAKLQHSVRQGSYETFAEFSRICNERSRKQCTLRGLLSFRKADPVPLEEVEPAKDIVTRFCTGAMSFGSISKEAHETLAVAMNRLGGKSNTGEGGEEPSRFIPDPNGDRRSSAIKQVASGRFGVTSHYLVNAREIQIKMAQGAKPGEGGQLPGHKVNEIIAKTRYSTPYVTLISPPPHHDIYSIEDLAQLIFDLKNANNEARISVKLVAEVGVGTVAAGVAKAKADGVLISGHDGGTGASPLSSIKHAGIPWEIGLAETQQVLVLNDLRSRIRVQTDGQLKTGRDVVVAALLGAEEFGFATAPLVATGCLLMRKCHLNTCPVGIATQDPRLRKKFAGKPEHVVNYFFFVAEEVRRLMAQLGFRKMDEMIGRVEMLETSHAIDHWKAKGIDLSTILFKPDVPADAPLCCLEEQDHGLDEVLDHQLIELAAPAIEDATPVEFDLPIRNANRATGAMLGSEVSRKYGGEGLPDNTIRFHFRGSAGQSFGAFLPRGITLVLEGDSNDYIGKGLSGGRIIVYPPVESTFIREENILIGNTVLYGATGGEAYFSGLAGERFAVRMSGASAVVEGVGDHGCEYMTKGVAVILGPTGRNFAAGMSGGIAFVLDAEGNFRERCNTGMVELESVTEDEDIEVLRTLIENHVRYTDSPRAMLILSDWESYLPRFVKVMPTEYRLALERLREEQAAPKSTRGVGEQILPAGTSSTSTPA